MVKLIGGTAGMRPVKSAVLTPSLVQRPHGVILPEPNISRIAQDLKEHNQTEDLARKVDLIAMASRDPSMDALASSWAASHGSGVRIVEGFAINRILAAGDRAFNLRVADPYLAYQRQGLGFTWSCFSPKDKQDTEPRLDIFRDKCFRYCKG